MPIEFIVICPSDFVRIDADEYVDFEESKKTLRGLAEGCRKRGLDRAMLDIREVPLPNKPRFTNTEVAALVGTFQAAGFSKHQRLAVLYRQDVYGGIRTFTFFSRMRGLHVQAFNEFETAVDWLWKCEANPEQNHGAEVPISRQDAKRRAADLADGTYSVASPRRSAR